MKTTPNKMYNTKIRLIAEKPFIISLKIPNNIEKDTIIQNFLGFGRADLNFKFSRAGSSSGENLFGLDIWNTGLNNFMLYQKNVIKNLPTKS